MRVITQDPITGGYLVSTNTGKREWMSAYQLIGHLKIEVMTLRRELENLHRLKDRLSPRSFKHLVRAAEDRLEEQMVHLHNAELQDRRSIPSLTEES